MYKILYEDGDGEDLNEKEFKAACMLYNAGATETKSDNEDSDNDKWCYNSDIEISEYSASEEESTAPAQKKKQTNSRNGKDTKPKRRKGKDTKPVSEQTKPIDVKALLAMGSKKSVMGKTLAAMTDEQTSSMITTAEAALQKQAKKSLRDNALKVKNISN